MGNLDLAPQVGTLLRWWMVSTLATARRSGQVRVLPAASLIGRLWIGDTMLAVVLMVARADRPKED